MRVLVAAVFGGFVIYACVAAKELFSPVPASPVFRYAYAPPSPASYQQPRGPYAARNVVLYGPRVPPAGPRMQLPNPFGGGKEGGEKPPDISEEELEAMANLPKFGGFVAPPRPERPEFKFELPSFGGDEPLKLYPSDVQFTDVDGDLITLREAANNKVNMYVGNKLVFEQATLKRNGNTLEVTGTVKKGTPLSFIGFNLEEKQTEGTTPKNPEDLDKAMALVE
jgi:hypothetical protein